MPEGWKSESRPFSHNDGYGHTDTKQRNRYAASVITRYRPTATWPTSAELSVASRPTTAVLPKFAGASGTYVSAC